MKILTILNKIIIINKDDINLDIIFKNIILHIILINENLLGRHISATNQIISFGHSIIEGYEEIKSANLKKKGIEINFLKIKKKELPSLDPEIDSAFLGRSFLPRTNAENQKVARAIQKKIKSTKKQAIRNLKKEAKVIDVQRQKKNRIMEGKKKEDQKLSNQFIEQQNVEYKKLVTSQGQKRFKLKHKREDTRNKK